jgi:hypothetical protein
MVTGLEVPPAINQLRRFTMKFLGHRKIEIDRAQWEAYRQLELVPDRVDRPQSDRASFKFGIDRVWRTLISLLLDELVTEQKIDYLDRCWGSHDLDEGKRSPSQTLQRFLTLIG